MRSRHDIAIKATGLLRTFNEYGAIGIEDVQPAMHLSYLYGERDERVQLALAFTVRALRAGSVCIDLKRSPELARSWLADSLGDDELPEIPAEAWPDLVPWLQAIEASPAVSMSDLDARPLRYTDGRLYLTRYWNEQETVRSLIQQRLHVSQPVAATPDADPQDHAVATALTSPLTIIAGGPGTGKTRVISNIVSSVQASSPSALIGLAAPTGKAASRMTEALREAGIEGIAAQTVHRLLGNRPRSRTRFFHDATNPLPHDVVIIDELSMVSITMMSRLLAALKPQSRLVLVGDPDQLTSVEAGAVLADLTQAPSVQPVICHLTKNYRSNEHIQRLASAIKANDADEALALLSEPGSPVRLVEPHVALSEVRDRCVASGRRLYAAAQAGDDQGALAALAEHRLLCAHRMGPVGVSTWTDTVLRWLRAEVPGFRDREEFYTGRPLLATVNAPELGLYNGETGVVVGREAVFETGTGLRRFSPFLLDRVQTLYAMTVHKSQGSQFGSVTLVLPDATSPLLTRELLYTAVTRAHENVLIVGTPDALHAAIERPTARTSGLAQRL